MALTGTNGHGDMSRSNSPAIALTATLKVSNLPLPTRIAFVGNYLPRQCGIATFTTDLCARSETNMAGRLFAIPVNDPESSYDYPRTSAPGTGAGRPGLV